MKERAMIMLAIALALGVAFLAGIGVGENIAMDANESRVIEAVGRPIPMPRSRPRP